MEKRTFSKTLETPSGEGEIYLAGERLASVSYWLQKKQEFSVIESLNGRSETPGETIISGEVTLDLSDRWRPDVLEAMNSRQVLTLHLSDGRRLDFFSSRGDPFSATFRVTSASKSGFVSSQPTKLHHN